MTEQNRQNSHLVITALGSDRPGLVSDFSKTVFDCGCTIDDSRMIVLGGEFALLVQVSGSWNTIAKLESGLKAMEQNLGLALTARRTREKFSGQAALPYAIDVVAMDHPGIVHHLANFLAEQGINIEEMSTNRYFAAHTGTPMYCVRIRIWIPANTPLSEFRDTFIEKCDELNLDAVIEPIKN